MVELDREALTRIGARVRLDLLEQECASLRAFIDGIIDPTVPVAAERMPARRRGRPAKTNGVIHKANGAVPTLPTRRKPNISAAGRAAIARAQRKRWRKIKAEKAAAQA